jgi:hypothetical protein
MAMSRTEKLKIERKGREPLFETAEDRPALAAR